MADHHGHGFIHYLDFQHDFFLGLNQRAALVGKGFGIRLDLLDHQAAQRSRAAQNFFEFLLLASQPAEFLLDLDGFQPRQLAQADFQNVLGLPFP